MFSHFGTVPAYDGRTDGQTHDDSIYCASIASRGKKLSVSQPRMESLRHCHHFGTVGRNGLMMPVSAAARAHLAASS